MISGQAFVDVSLPPKLKDTATNIFFLRDSLTAVFFVCIKRGMKEVG